MIRKLPTPIFVVVTSLAAAVASQPAWSQPPPAGETETKPAAGQPTEDEDPADELADRQQRLSAKFAELEKAIEQLAEFSAHEDPRRAAVLQQVFAESQQREVKLRFAALVELLRQEQFAKSIDNQTELRTDLAHMLELMLKEDRARRLETEKRRIERLLKSVSRLIKEQRGVKARTEGGDQADRLADDQQRIADKTQQLGGELADRAQAAGDIPDGTPDGKPQDKPGDGDKPDEDPDGKQGPGKGDSDKKETDPDKKDGGKPQADQDDKPNKPGDNDSGKQPKSAEGGQQGQPQQGKPQQGKPQQGKPQQGQPQQGGQQPSPPQQQPDQDERIGQRLQQAQQRMRQAQQKLEEAERDGAVEDQQQALQELEQAKAELEEILRQLREEEIDRALVLLERRFRDMHQAQMEVYEETVKLDEQEERGRRYEVACGRLSRDEADIIRDADRALALLHEEGSAVAFPEAVGQMREDMQQVAERLAQAKAGQITQGLEEDILAALEEMIEALKQEREEREKKKQQPQQAQQGQQREPSLVDILAEIKMIRALQMRINQRTARYSEMIAGEQAERPDLLDALQRLGARQQRIFHVVRDIHLGKNK